MPLRNSRWRPALSLSVLLLWLAPMGAGLAVALHLELRHSSQDSSRNGSQDGSQDGSHHGSHDGFHSEAHLGPREAQPPHVGHHHGSDGHSDGHPARHPAPGDPELSLTGLHADSPGHRHRHELRSHEAEAPLPRTLGNEALADSSAVVSASGSPVPVAGEDVPGTSDPRPPPRRPPPLLLTCILLL